MLRRFSRHRLWLAAWLWILGATSTSACDCAAPLPDEPSCTSSRDCRADQACVERSCVPRRDGGPESPDAPFYDAPSALRPEALVVEPEAIDLVIAADQSSRVDLTVRTRWSDGSIRVATAPVYDLEDRRLGAVDSRGSFETPGRLGGRTLLHVRADGLGLDVPVVVRVETVIHGDGLPADIDARFSGEPLPDLEEATTIAYPLEGAVMPQNVFPADVQWLGGARGDVFRVRLSKSDAAVIAYLPHDDLRHFQAEPAAWRSVVQTDPEEPLVIDVTRWQPSSGRLTTSTPVQVTFARAALTGSVYYWDIEAGRILRIHDGTDERESFMPTPPMGIYGFDCVGCHTVSPSGRYMAGRLDGGNNIGAIFDLTRDLTGSPPPTRFPISTTPPSAMWWFSSWSPDETRLVTSQEPYGPLRFLDATTGAWIDVEAASPLPTNVTQPAWAPDGSAIAFVSDTEWQGTDNLRGNLSILPLLGPDHVGTARLLHRATDIPDGGLSDSYPTWTPDSLHLAFGHGLDARSERGSGGLFTIRPDGAGVTRLDTATDGARRLDDFQPRFSPFHQGGYYWLSFLSRRDYGNEARGTRGSGRQQIWVTAIRDDEIGTGADPSSVAYWLPGQATTSRNISAYWAPRACRRDGEACESGSECCGGECAVDPSGAYVCSPPPDDRCRNDGETCTHDSDCCEGRELSCYSNVCVQAPI